MTRAELISLRRGLTSTMSRLPRGADMHSDNIYALYAAQVQILDLLLSETREESE